jgi:hypothetical protein
LFSPLFHNLVNSFTQAWVIPSLLIISFTTNSLHLISLMILFNDHFSIIVSLLDALFVLSRLSLRCSYLREMMKIFSIHYILATHVISKLKWPIIDVVIMPSIFLIKYYFNAFLKHISSSITSMFNSMLS